MPTILETIDKKKPSILEAIDANTPSFFAPTVPDPQGLSSEGLKATVSPLGGPIGKKVRPWREEIDAALKRGGLNFLSAGANLMGQMFAMEPITPLGGRPFEPRTPKQKLFDIQEAAKWENKAEFLWELSKSPEIRSQNTDFLSNILNPAFETAPYITGTTLATITGGPLAAFSVGSAVEGNSSYRTTLDWADKLEAEGKTEEAKALRTRAGKIALAVGLFSGGIEVVGGGIADDILMKATARLRSKILKGGAVFTVGSLIEGLEEASQELAQLTGESTYREINWREWLERTKQSGKGGVALGGIFRGTSMGARGLFSQQREGLISPAEQAVMDKWNQRIEERKQRGGPTAKQDVEAMTAQANMELDQTREQASKPVDIREFIEQPREKIVEQEHERLFTGDLGPTAEETFLAEQEALERGKEKPPISSPGMVQEEPATEKQPPITKEERNILVSKGYSVGEVLKMDRAKARELIGKKAEPVPKETVTPPVVQKEVSKKNIGAINLTTESRDAVNILDQYWKFKDEKFLEANVAEAINQESIAKALGKRTYNPETDQQTKMMSQAIMLNIDLKEHPSGHEFVDQLTDKQKQIYELSQNLPPQIQEIADSIAAQNRQVGQYLKDEDVIRNARENYIAHIWEKPTAKKQPLFAKFRQKTARRLPRNIEGGIVEGWSRGLNLRIADVTEASRIARQQGIQALAGKKLLDMGKDWGLMSHTQRVGWEQVEHPNFTYWRKAGDVEIEQGVKPKKDSMVRPADRKNLGKVMSVSGNTAEVRFINREKGTMATKTFPLEDLEVVRPVGKNFFITDDGVIMEKMPVYAEPVLAKKLNKIFSTSGLFKIPGIKTITEYNAILKSTILSTSFFHHQAFLRSTMMGSRTANPKKAYDIGKQAIRNLEPELRLLVRNGMTIGKIQDYDAEMVHGKRTIWGRVLSHSKLTDKGRQAFVNIQRANERFLFNKLGPNLKAGAALIELRAEMKKNKTKLERGEITADEIAKSVAVLMNNDFGGLHLGRLERRATAQHLFRLLCLAPDWTESNVRSMVQMLNKGETGRVHRLFWGRIAAKGLGATIALNLLLSGFDDEDFKERYKKAWETGRLRWLDVDITPIYKAAGGKDDKRKYFSLIGHFRDPVKFVTHPGRSMKHKASVFGRIMTDFVSGQDWAGRKFTTVSELSGLTEDGKLKGRLVKWSPSKAEFVEPWQTPSFIAYQARSAMPIQIQNSIAYLGGEMDAFDAITKSLGMMTATTYPEKKPQTNLFKTLEQKPLFKELERKSLFK